MMKSTLLSLLVVALHSILSAQTTCGPFDPMAEDCATACLVCDFTEVLGSTSSFSGGSALGFCGVLTNDQWIGFVAGGPVATITLTPSNCQSGDGLQLAIYADCNGTPIDCNGGFTGGGAATLQLTNVPLIYGQPYYVLVDGYIADICNFSLNISPLSAVKPPDVQTPTAINGLSKVCPDGSAVYSIPSQLDGASKYVWNAPPGSTINGQVPPVTIDKLGGGTQVTVTFGNVGGSISVTPSNTCKTGGQRSKPVTVSPIPPTFLPREYVCPEAYPNLNGSATFSTTYASASGCDSTVITTITARPKATANLGTLSFCPDDSIKVCGQYYKNAGDYSFKCTSWAGCDSLITFKIVKPTAEILGGGSLNCFNGAVTLQAGGGSGSAIWKDTSGQIIGTNSIYTATIAGKYTLEWTATTNGKVCTTTRDIVVRETDTLRITTQPIRTLTCAELTVTLQAKANMPASFAWDGPGGYTSNQINPMTPLPGQYTVFATTSGGCTASATVTVDQDIAMPNLSVVNDVLTCANPILQLDAVSSNAPQTLRYEWTGPNGFTSLLKNPIVGVPGSYTIVVTNTLNGCYNSATATVSLDAVAPVVNATGGYIGCTSSPKIALTVTYTNVTNPVVQWIGPNNFTSNLLAPIVSVPGTYTVVVTNPANGCSSTATAEVYLNTASFSATATGGTLNCQVNTINLNATASSGGVVYAWSGPGGFTSTVQNPAAAFPGLYTVTVTNVPTGCTAIATASVMGDFAPAQAGILGGNINCIQSSVVLNAFSITPLVGYRWSGPNGFAATQQQVTVTQAGLYTVTVTRASNGCTGTAVFEVVTDTNRPVVTASGGILGCNPPTLRLNSATTIANGTFAWSGPHGFMSSLPTPIVNRPGTYRVTVTNPGNGCSNSVKVVVYDNGDAPQVFLSLESIGGGKRQINCFTTAVVPTFVWAGPNGFTSNNQNPVITDPGTYTVLVTDGISDCQTYYSILVPVGISVNGNLTNGRAAPTGQGWSLYPNPSPGQVQLRYLGDEKPGQAYVTVLDGLGRNVAERNFSDALDLSMDLSALPEGLYRILLHTDRGIETKNLSIQR